MFAPVLQHVNERIPDFARGFEPSHVIAVTPDSSATAEDAVHRLRKSDGESLDAPRQRAAVLRLDHEVEVIALYGELENPKATSRSQCQAATDGAKKPTRAQGGQYPLRAQRYVRGMSSPVKQSPPVWHADLPSGWLAASARTSTTPGARTEVERELAVRRRHLD